MKVFHDPGFAAPIGNHIMPIGKFELVAGRLRELKGLEILSPQPVGDEDILRVHTPDYLRAIKTGEPRELAESQKFPWSPALYPSVCLTSGGVLAAARAALDDGVASALASGFHHSSADHGEGFCTFNGLVVALEAMRAAGEIQTAAVLDLDLHYGNGTAALAASRPWLRVLSIYGNDYMNNVPYRNVSVRRHNDGPNHHSVPLVPAGEEDGSNLLKTLSDHLPWLVEGDCPDVLLYQAGADPLHSDPYSPLSLDHEDLFLRDRAVFAFARQHQLPAAWVLAGGYSPDIQQIVEAHVNTALAAIEVYSLS